MSNDNSMFTLGFSPRSNRKASPGFVGGKGERPQFVVRSHERIGGSMTWKANEFSHGTGPARPCCSSMHRRRVKAIGVCDIVGAPRVGALSRRNRRLITAATVFASTRCSSVNDSLGDEGDCPTPSTPRVRWRLGMMVRGGAPAARRPRMFRCHTRSGHPRMMMMMMLAATYVDTARSTLMDGVGLWTRQFPGAHLRAWWSSFSVAEAERSFGGTAARTAQDQPDSRHDHRKKIVARTARKCNHVDRIDSRPWIDQARWKRGKNGVRIIGRSMDAARITVTIKQRDLSRLYLALV